MTVLSIAVLVTAALAEGAAARGAATKVSTKTRKADAFVNEVVMGTLLESVVKHKPRKLPIPWSVEDAYMRDYEAEKASEPVLPWAEGEVVVYNLSSTLELFTTKLKGEQLSITPPGEIRTGGKGAAETLHLNGVHSPSAELVRIAWQKLRWRAITAWLEEKLIEDPTKLAIMYSHGDTLLGGCTELELTQKYDQILRSAGPTQTVVAAAELSPFPASLGWRYAQTNLTGARMSMLSSHEIAGDWVSPYADCAPAAGPCSSPPAYQYLNSGFLMGPVQDLYEIVSELPSYAGPENLWINEYYLKNPGRITVDFTGGLAMSLHNMKTDSLPVEVQTGSDGKKSVKSKVSGETVCFVYGNGNSFAPVKGLATAMAA